MPRKTVQEKEDEQRAKPVEYHANGTVKFPVTYSQLLRECERLHAIVSHLAQTFHQQQVTRKPENYIS